MPTIVQNNTAGTFADNQIYVTILGKDPVTGNLAWVNADGRYLRCAYRHKVPPDSYAYSIGFRIAYSLK